jgi:hypothetical protein
MRAEAEIAATVARRFRVRPVRRRHRGPVACYTGLPVASEPSGPQRLAAAVIASALELARRGDPAERRWLVNPRRLEPWAGALGISGARLADLARAALRRLGEGRPSDF